jgi:Tfp pilus assembly pilus retraction ATPase PilT
VQFVLDSQQGLTAIPGDVGLGKSTIIGYLFNEFNARDDIAATMIASPNFPSEAITSQIAPTDNTLRKG